MRARGSIGVTAYLLAVGLLAAPAVRGFQATAPPPAAAAQPPQIPHYPDSAKGLTALVDDIVQAINKGDAALVKAYMDSLVLADANSWFPDIFEKDLGQESAAEYAEIAPLLPGVLEAAFRKMAEKDATDIKTYRFDGVCDVGINGNIIVLLSLRRHSKPLYEIRFNSGDRSREIWAFAYANGGFRYIGNTRIGFGKSLKETPVEHSEVAAQAKPGDSGAPRVRVQGLVQQAKMIHQVQPDYPDAARANHITGTVVLHAIIGKDGQVQQIEVTKGPCILDEAAIRAVRKWRYFPTKLNGEPVEVDTTISVTFTLGR